MQYNGLHNMLFSTLVWTLKKQKGEYARCSIYTKESTILTSNMHDNGSFEQEAKLRF